MELLSRRIWCERREMLRTESRCSKESRIWRDRRAAITMTENFLHSQEWYNRCRTKSLACGERPSETGGKPREAEVSPKPRPEPRLADEKGNPPTPCPRVRTRVASRRQPIFSRFEVIAGLFKSELLTLFLQRERVRTRQRADAARAPASRGVGESDPHDSTGNPDVMAKNEVSNMKNAGCVAPPPLWTTSGTDSLEVTP